MKLTIRLRTWSGTFLDELQMAWAEECEKIIGALDVAKASSIVGTKSINNWATSWRQKGRWIYLKHGTSRQSCRVDSFQTRQAVIENKWENFNADLLWVGFICHQLPSQNETIHRCEGLVQVHQPYSNLWVEQGKVKSCLEWKFSRKISRTFLHLRRLPSLKRLSPFHSYLNIFSFNISPPML